jgi:hypothetical protein
MPQRIVETKYGHIVKVGPWKVNDFAEWKGEGVRITALSKNGKEAHVSNMNMPFCGCLNEWAPLAKLRRPR